MIANRQLTECKEQANSLQIRRNLPLLATDGDVFKTLTASLLILSFLRIIILHLELKPL